MRKIRFIVLALLALAMMAMMAGCGKSEDKGDDSKTTTKAVETKAPETEAPETEAPETDAPETEAPVQEIHLSLNVYANHGKDAFKGEPITVTEDGTYTVVFDCATAGTDYLGEFGALYISDYDVLCGKVAESTISSAQITYDKVVVDGKEMTVTNTDAAEAVNSSDIFDTGKPMNAWDGSVIADDEYTLNKEDFAISFNQDNVQKVEVTFTLSDIQWR